MTASAMKGDREQCLAAGMDGYVSKPIDVAQLFRVLEQVVASPDGVAMETGGRDQTAEPAMDDVIDLEQARRRLPWGEQSLGEFAHLLHDESGKLLAEIQFAVSSRDAIRLQRSAHTLRGSSDLFGARSVVAAAGRMELLGRDSQFKAAVCLLPELETATHRLRSALARVAGQGLRPNMTP